MVDSVVSICLYIEDANNKKKGNKIMKINKNIKQKTLCTSPKNNIKMKNVLLVF